MILNQIESKLFEHKIQIRKNALIQQVRGKVPTNVEEWVNSQVNKLKDMGVIRESKSPFGPVVVVKKKVGDFRLCIDYRRLNSVTITPIYSIPDSQSLFNHLSQATMFSSIDI